MKLSGLNPAQAITVYGEDGKLITLYVPGTDVAQANPVIADWRGEISFLRCSIKITSRAL